MLAEHALGLSTHFSKVVRWSPDLAHLLGLSVAPPHFKDIFQLLLGFFLERFEILTIRPDFGSETREFWLQAGDF